MRKLKIKNLEEKKEKLENEMKKTDPYSEEWEKMAADWTYCSTRIIAFTWLYHALSHYERR